MISLFLFFLAGFLEIGGGYLIWLWLGEDKSWILGVIGSFILFLYEIIPTLQPAHFGRVYAAYGGDIHCLFHYFGTNNRQKETR